ncbi:MAG: hypothetical protein JKY43_00295, partial [Phycisphaerales bacterium]|nr:hypothetical protein [Phycisphaerales bacterium]
MNFETPGERWVFFCVYHRGHRGHREEGDWEEKIDRGEKEGEREEKKTGREKRRRRGALTPALSPPPKGRGRKMKRRKTPSVREERGHLPRKPGGGGREG